MYAGQMIVAPAVRAAGAYGLSVGDRGDYVGSSHPYSETEAI